MIISHKYNFIFVKTRKTAGSTFEKLMSPYLGENDVCTGSSRDGTPALNIQAGTNGHIPLKDIMSKYFPQGTNYDIITIERNPYDKVVSSYYWHQHIKPHMFGEMSFGEYMKSCNLLPQDWELYQPINNVKVFKYEKMGDLYTWLKKMRGLHISLDKVGQTKLKSGIRKVKDYKELHNDTTKKIVSQLFADEIKEFRYEF